MHVFPFYEVAFVGSEANELAARLFHQHPLANTILLGARKDSDLELLENKYVEGRTLIYVCLDKMCKLPVTDADRAYSQIRFD